MNFLQTNSYCVEVAKLFGVKSAVFLSYLWQNIAHEEKSEDVVMCRKDVLNCTGLDESDQRAVESALSDSGVLVVKPFRGTSEKCYYTFNQKKFDSIQIPTGFFPFESEPAVPKEKKVARKTSRQIMVNVLKSSIEVGDEVLQQYLCDWIDAVYANPKNCLTKQALQINIDELMKISNENDRIEILRIAIKRSWRDMQWAIDDYYKNRSSIDSNWKPYDESVGNIQKENGAF